MSAPRMSADDRRVESLRIDVYDGRVHIGTVKEATGGQFEATLPTGDCLGLFTCQAAAANALFETRRL